MVSEIVSLIFLSHFLLFEYNNSIEFCVFVLYPVTLLNSLMSCSSFPVVFLQFSMYSILSSANSDSFTSSFAFCIHFISFYSLIAGLGLPKLCWKKVAIINILDFFWSSRRIFLEWYLYKHLVSKLALQIFHNCRNNSLVVLQSFKW